MRYSWVIFQFLFLACTIIEDSDITSQQELDNLKLTSIEIKEELSSGSGSLTTSTLKASLSKETTTNIVAVNGTITKQLWMDWPALTSKFKLKNGATTSFKSCTSFLQNGKPANFFLTNSNSDTLEFYRFWYSSKGQLNKVVSFIGVNAPTNDTLIYNNPSNPSELSYIVRRSSDATKAGTFALQGGSTNSAWFSFEFRSIRYSKSCQGGGCSGQQYWGGNYDAVNPSTNFPIGVLNLYDGLGSFLIQDINHTVSVSYCQGNCKQGNDAYYLHPFMILKDKFELGNTLTFFYMVDWWQPISTTESTDDEKVTFSYKYEL